MAPRVRRYDHACALPPSLCRACRRDWPAPRRQTNRQELDSAPASEIEAPVRGTAQVPALGTPKEDELRRPFLRAARTAAPPTIDGDLTDEVWARGTPQKTEIRVLYDDDALYFAAWCYDTEPDEITASLMRRDANVRNQDSIMILLDPFGERRSGYAFAVTPIITRWDALIEETGGYNQEWDGIWYAQARRNDEGWRAGGHPRTLPRTSRNASAIDARTTRHFGFARSQKLRKRVEEVFGWMKTTRLLRKTRHRGVRRVGWVFVFTAAVYNLVRMRTLLAT